MVIFDTAGRLTVDEALMEQLHRIEDLTDPDNVLLVCDSMIGQESVHIARSFNERIKLTGFILTKLDGDARGGAPRRGAGLPSRLGDHQPSEANTAHSTTAANMVQKTQGRICRYTRANGAWK